MATEGITDTEQGSRPERPGEFELIARYLAPLTRNEPGALGLTDDAAILSPPVGQQLVVTMDTLVAGVHFHDDDSPESVAVKVLGVNLSDLAAMGATPWFYTLSTAWPTTSPTLDYEPWIAAFCRGLATAQDEHNIVLVGGDTVGTPGPRTLTVMAAGTVPTGKGVTRSGASVGDDIYVSGTLGDGALGLLALQGRLDHLGSDDRAALVDRYRRPNARTVLGPRLIGLASAAIDVSDGLLADLGHMCRGSGCGALIDQDALPLSPAAQRAIAGHDTLLGAIATGGDDYELLFSVTPERAAAVMTLSKLLDLPLTRIGATTEGQSVTLRDQNGVPVRIERAGFQHF